MNQYFLKSLSLKRAYVEHKPALKRLLSILSPSQDTQGLWEKQRTCTEVNDDIDRYIKRKLGKSTADLCIDYFVALFGDGKIDCEQATLEQTVAEIMKQEQLIRTNIEKRCK